MSLSVSFEVFPPKTLQGSFRLWETIHDLAPFDPTYVSVTYGAGGGTRARTHEAVTAIGDETGLEVAAHLTCVEATRAETLEIAESYRTAGITQIVALRGDVPGGGDFRPHPDGFASSLDMVEALSGRGFSCRVGAYPEVHPNASSETQNINWLKAKLDAGATEAVTQFFFEAETFLRFRDACEKAGIDKPIVPGVMPVASWSGAQKFARACGARVPAWMVEAYDKATRDGREDLLSIALATELCDTLISEGVEHVHFYTLNRPELTRKTCRALGLTAQPRLRDVA